MRYLLIEHDHRLVSVRGCAFLRRHSLNQLPGRPARDEVER